MKIRFKTQLKTGAGVMPAGSVIDMPDAKAKAYIERGLAVACEEDVIMTAEEKAAQQAAKKAAAEQRKKEKDAAKNAADEAKKAGTGQTNTQAEA